MSLRCSKISVILRVKSESGRVCRLAQRAAPEPPKDIARGSSGDLVYLFALSSTCSKMATLGGRKLTDLRVVDLRQELEVRGL